MAIEFPDFKGTHCVGVSICGELLAQSPELKRFLKSEPRPMMAQFSRNNEKLFLRVNLVDHFHVDVVKAQFFKERPEGAVKLSVASIQKKLERVVAEKIGANVFIRASFQLKSSELSDRGMVRSLMLKSNHGNVGIEMTAAKFVITGAPVSEMSWRSLPDEMIGIVFESSFDRQLVSEDYLLRAFKQMQTAFDVFVCGKTLYEAK